MVGKPLGWGPLNNQPYIHLISRGYLLGPISPLKGLPMTFWSSFLVQQRHTVGEFCEVFVRPFGCSWDREMLKWKMRVPFREYPKFVPPCAMELYMIYGVYIYIFF